MLLKMEKDVNARLRDSRSENIPRRERILTGGKKEMQQRACARNKLW
jgi:hypothetical protein